MTEQKSIKERLRHEFREYAIVSLYLYVCFGVLLLYKSAILESEGVAYVPLGLAAGKALILGKFLLIGEAAGAGSWTQAHNLLVHILRKVGALLVALILLTIAEELIVGWIHGGSAADSDSPAERRSLMEIVATLLYILLVLIPYVATQEISRALGPGVLRSMLLGKRMPDSNGSDTTAHT